MIERVHIMGIVNLTPDSFYSGSRVPEVGNALSRIHKMLEEGADVIDLGACSTRPGAPRPSMEEEWSRLEPTLRALAASEVPALSVDTYRAEIVRRVYDVVGPYIVNDIGGGELDADMLSTVGELGLPYVAMCPACATTEDILAWFQDFSRKADAYGIREWILDPGFGFGKTLEQNYEVLARLDEIVKAFPQEVLVGVSRKSMIYKALGITPEEAMPATEVIQFAALEKGATWLRAHDVAAAVQTAKLYSTIYTSSPGAAK